MSEKAVTYRPHWKQYYSSYVWAYAAIPLFGAGFYFLRKLDRKRRNQTVCVFNDKIRFGDDPDSRVVRIQDLQTVRRNVSKVQAKHGLACVIITTESDELLVSGIPAKEAENLENALYLAIETEKKHRALREKAKGDYDDTIKTGGLEHLNSLIGMWQQGLISEEDFEKEQQKFRKQ